MSEVRRATPADAAEIVRIVNRAYRVEDFFIIGNRTDEADVRARLARPDAVFLVLEGDTPGTLAGAVYAERRGDRAYFGLLSVDPEYQGRGWSRKLIAGVEAYGRQGGCRHLDLDIVDLRTELPAYYAALGFTPCGTAPFGNPEKLKRPASMVLMTKSL